MPRAVIPHQNVRGAELTVVGSTAICSLLIMNPHYDCAVSEDASLCIAPGQRGGDKIATAVAVQPLRLVDDEPKRSDQFEIFVGQGVEDGEVAGRSASAQRLPNSSSSVWSSFITSILSRNLLRLFRPVCGRLPGHPPPNVSSLKPRSRS